MTKAEELPEAAEREREPAVDPFASDLFAAPEAASGPGTRDVPAGPVERPAPERRPDPLPAWAARLPKVSRTFVASSSHGEVPLDRLPPEVSKAIGDAVGEILFAASGGAECVLESVIECDLSAEVRRSADAGDLAIPIVFGPTGSLAVVTIGGSTVHRIIDKVFGPSHEEAFNRISPIESAVVEFIAIKAVGRINDVLGDGLFFVGEAAGGPIELFGENEAGVTARLKIEEEGSTHSFRVLASHGFHAGFKGRSGEPGDGSTGKLFRTVRSVALRLQIGTTRLDAATLGTLEPGDVVLIEEPQLDWAADAPRGEAVVLAGAGGLVLIGQIEEGGSIRVRLSEVHGKERFEEDTAGSTKIGRNMNDTTFVEAGHEGGTNETNGQSPRMEESGEISAPLENLQLRLRVELAGKAVTLRELNKLRAGQVIDLERGPADLVKLVLDGSDETVGVGEIVDIDGRLGVRLTKVFI